MKKHLGLIVLAAGVAIASLGAAQTPTPVPPAAPAPMAAVPAPPAPPAAPAPFASVTPPPSAAPAALPVPPAGPPPASAPFAAPPAPQRPPAPPKPAKPAETPKPADAPAQAAPPEPPRERADAEPVNVRFEVTVSSQTGTAAPLKRSAIVTVSNGAVSGPTGSGMLRSGNSIPVPTTTLTTKGEDGKETPAARPLTSYNYRSVGLNVDVSNVVILSGGRVRAMLSVEFSGVDDKYSNTTGAPSFPTFSQRLSLFFDSGKPLIVAQSSDLVDNLERKQTVEVKATILR